MRDSKKATKLAKTALAKNRVTRVITSGYEDELAQFSSLKTHLGIDLSGNTVTGSDIDRKVTALANLFGVVFDSNGNITGESYTTHTHNYDNNGTSDTTDGVN